MLRMRLPQSSLFVPLLLYSCLLVAQDAPASAGASGRPTLGLVLEGGGALGLAHVGVILWLEEHHIPVNYIAGTSMGGLVGGAYATGIGATELRQLVEGINWDEVMSGTIPYPDLAFRRKEDANAYPNSMEFGLRKGVQFPSGFNTGQHVSLIIDRLALPYSNVGSFDNLPIPFACVATNLVTGKAEVFRNGQLSTAMRATMSIPGVFTPVSGKDGIFADGGLLNNIPVDVAKKMGADVVIGVHFDTRPIDADAKLSSFAVLNRAISVMISANELRSMEAADLLITVPLAKFNIMDFSHAKEIIQAGYDAAAAKEKVLSAFSVDQAMWKQYLAARNARRRKDPTPEFVAVSGANPDMSRLIETRMSPVLGGPIDFNDLNNRILRLNGLGRFSSVSYQYTEKDGRQGLEVHTEEKPYAPPLVEPLLLIDGASYNNAQFNLGARVTFMDVGGFHSELRNDIILFSEYGLSSEYYHPFNSTSRWFIAPRANFNDLPYYIYSEKAQIATYRQRTGGGGVDVGRIFGNTSEFRAGYEGGWQRYARQSGSPTLPIFSGAFGDMRLQYKMDRLDEAMLPRQGHYFLGSFKWTNVSPVATNQYPVLEGASLNYFKLNERSSTFVHGWGGTTFDFETGVPQFSLGGSVRMLAYGQNELLVDKYFMGQGGYMYRFARLPALVGDGIYAIGTIEGGKVYGTLPTGLGKLPNLPGDIAAAVVVKTLFGPAQFGYAYGTTGHHKFYFRIGRLF